MARLSKYAGKSSAAVNQFKDLSVTNFMGGTSYKLSPLNTLRIIAASSIFGEPQYYREGESKPLVKNARSFEAYSIFASLYKNKSASEVFTNAIDAALDHDFQGTLDFALELRRDYFMRLNPAVIFIRASIHEKREEFNNANPGVMRSIGKAIAFRPDDLTNQFEYFMYINGSKKNLSSLVKRTWADKLKEFSRYQLNKYKGKRLIDLVRISHANSDDINELMKTGTLVMKDTEQTWETMRSAGKTWKEILLTLDVPHMALLRNLRGIFSEITDISETVEILDALKAGVAKGKQFPFRYFSAYKAIENEAINNKGKVMDALEDCIDASVSNMPKLKGRTMCLSDNSGSSWGSLNSEYGSVKIAEIANLSSLITAMQSDEGEIGLFGDKLNVYPVSKRNGLLKQHKDANEVESVHGKLGGGTENGIWIFFRDAIKNKTVYDNIFVYSDQQAGHGGLYGTNPTEYREFIHNSRYIDVLTLLTKYRETVNPKVNFFTVQVAGYDNTIVPENIYRGAILAGWTGKEPIFAKSLIDAWDSVEKPAAKKRASAKTQTAK